MKNETCKICGGEYQLGYSGTVEGCDICLGIVRDENGHAYHGGQSNHYRPLYSNYTGKVGPGDTVRLSPSRKKK